MNGTNEGNYKLCTLVGISSLQQEYVIRLGEPQSHTPQQQEEELLGVSSKHFTDPLPNISSIQDMSAAAAAAAAATSYPTTTGVIVPTQRVCATRREERRGHKAGVIVGAAVVAAGAAYLIERHRCRRDCDDSITYY